MSIKSEIDTLSSYMQNLDDTRTRYIEKLNSHGATLAANSDFIDIIEAIYNLYCEEHKTFVDINFSLYPTGTDISDISYNFGRLNVVRDAIFDALAARNVIPEDKSLNQMIPCIDEIDSEEIFRMDPLPVISQAVSTSTCRVSLVEDFDPEKTYYISSSRFDEDYTNWQTFETKDIDVHGTLRSIYTITDGSRIFFITAKVKPLVEPTFVEPIFNYGSVAKFTKLSIPASVEYSKLYYGFRPYVGIYQSQIYYGVDGEGTEFKLWYGDEIELENDNDPKVYIVLVDENDLIVGAGYANSKAGFVANTLYMNSESVDDVYDKTKINISSILTPGDKYCYMFGTHIPMYDEDITNLDLIGDWDGTSLIPAKDKDLFTFFEVTPDYKVRKYGNVIASVKIHELGEIRLTSTATEEDLESIITITSEKTDPANRWYFKFQDDTTLPMYGDDIDSGYSVVPDSTFTVYQTPGSKMVIVEYSDIDRIVAGGSVTIKSVQPYTKILCLKSEMGTNVGYTKVTVVSPPKDQNNIYLYTKGNAPIVYDDVCRGWTQWNGITEIPNFKEGDLITVAEVTNPGFKLRKVGVIGATPKPQELLPLTITSSFGSFEGYTYITVAPSISSVRNEYRYAFNVHTPELYDNVASWNLWDGTSEIHVIGDYGLYPTIVIAECNDEHLVLKVGSALAKIRSEDLRLNILNITLSAGSTSALAHIAVENGPNDLTGWKYKYIYMEEIIDLEDKSNYHWDCRGWNDVTDDEIVYRENQRLYVAICNDGDAAEYMGTTIAILPEPEPEPEPEPDSEP